jgi:hypothetical protein
MRYVDEIGSPAELPAEMGAIKSQQYRWMKGGAEVARKMLNTLWHSDAPLIRKIHGSVHLLSSSVFMLVLVLGAISVPLLYLRYELMSPMAVLAVNVLAGILQVSFYIFALMYLVTMFQRESSTENSLTRFLKNYIPFLSLSMGMSWHNSIAVLQGYMGKRTDFVRTPKMALKKKGDKWQNNKYLSKKVHKSVYIELMLAAYFAFGIGLALHYKAYNILPFFILEMVGFAVIGYYSVRHAKQLK